MNNFLLTLQEVFPLWDRAFLIFWLLSFSRRPDLQVLATLCFLSLRWGIHQTTWISFCVYNLATYFPSESLKFLWSLLLFSPAVKYTKLSTRTIFWLHKSIWFFLFTNAINCLDFCWLISISIHFVQLLQFCCYSFPFLEIPVYVKIWLDLWYMLPFISLRSSLLLLLGL